MSKLPGEVKLRIGRETKDEVWKLDELLSIIKSEVEAREASEGVKVSHGKLPNHQVRFHGHMHNTASSLYAGNGKVQCVYCNGEHYSASCEKVRGLKERRELLLKSGRCFNCLKNNHKSKDCSSQRNCRYCHKCHHQSICETHLSSSIDPQEPTETTSVKYYCDATNRH